MISTEKRCIFVHVPKTGGSSIEKVFKKLFDEKLNKGLNGSFSYEKLLKYPNFRNNNYFIHASASELQREYGDEKFNDYFKFATIRNPWDRLGSAYFWTYRTDKDHVFDKQWFINKYLASENNDKTSLRHLWSLNQYLCDSNDVLMVDFTINFNNFSTDFAEICKKLDVKNDLGVSNKGENKLVLKKEGNYREILGSEICAMIGEHYSKEIDKFFPEMKEK